MFIYEEKESRKKSVISLIFYPKKKESQNQRESTMLLIIRLKGNSQNQRESTNKKLLFNTHPKCKNLKTATKSFVRIRSNVFNIKVVTLLNLSFKSVEILEQF